jgi:hypothetical protein
MGRAGEARAEKLRALADEFRRQASETEMSFYIDLMTRTAADLEALADVAAQRRDEAAPLSYAEPTRHARPANRSASEAGE